MQRSPWTQPVRLLPLIAAAGTLSCQQAGPAAPPVAPRPAFHVSSLAANHAVTLYPAVAGIRLAGYTEAPSAMVEVLRPDATIVPLDPARVVVVARASVRFGPGGKAALNLAGGACWPGATPVLQADDVVRITSPGAGVEETRVNNLALERPELLNGDVVVHGTATNGFLNQPLPLGSLQQTLELPSGFFSNDEQALVATQAGEDGKLAYDAPVPVNPGDWTATFHGLGAKDIERCMFATAAITWRSPAGNEATVFQLPDNPAAEVALQPGCPAGLANAIVDSDHLTITPENEGADFRFSGVAAPEVTEVRLSVNDGPAATALMPPTGRPKAWSLVVPAAQVGVRNGNGPYTAFATFTGQPAPAVNLGANPAPFVTHKLKLPRATSLGAVTATPPGGLFNGSTRVELAPADPAAEIRYTTDGTVPTAASRAYTGVPIAMDRTGTLSFLALYPDGSSSPVQTEFYLIGGATPLRADPGGGTYLISQFVNLLLNAPGTIRYTTDGSDPTPASTAYTGAPVVITSPTTLRYRAFFPSGETSPLMQDVYTIQDASAPVLTARPFAVPPAIAKLGPQGTVEFFTTEQSTIRYTTNGSDPTDASPVYPPGGVPVTRQMLNTANPMRTLCATLKAVAVDLAGRRSPVFTLYVRQ